jgi:hypothetical protein
MPEEAHPNEWILTRGRMDWTAEPLCILVVIAAVAAYLANGRMSSFMAMAVACVIWLWFRRHISPNGVRYSKARIRLEHAIMLFIAAIALLTILAADWLQLPNASDFYLGISAFTFGAMIGGATRFARRLDREIQFEAQKLAHDSHAISYHSAD